MFHQRSQEVERRLETVLRLILTGRDSTPKLAEKVGVSIPTVSRCVAALCERGHDFRAEKHADGWAYHLLAEPARVSDERRSLRQ